MEANSTNDSAKKIPLENLPREELIKRCERFLTLAQKAKQARDVLQAENDELKNKCKSDSESVTNEIIEKLTEQKLSHVNTIEELKSQNIILNNKLQQNVHDLRICEEKREVLDSENVSFKRQLKRLTDENEQLITHLETLEQQIEECKQLGLEQQNQLLILEKSKEVLEAANQKLQHENANSHDAELEKMLNISLQEVKKLQSENKTVSEKVEDLRINLSEKDKNILIISEELQNKTKLVQNLKAQLENSDLEQVKTLKLKNEELQKKFDRLEMEMGELQTTREKNEILTAQIGELPSDQKWDELENENKMLKSEIQNLQLEAKLVETLKTQLEELQSENGILRSQNKHLLDLEQEISELRHLQQNQSKLDASNEVNEKLREKLKSYHGKIVKLAGNVTVLKENKNEILALLKTYTAQVEEWKEQLSAASLKLIQHIANITNQNLEYIAENNSLKESNAKFVQLLEAHKTDDEKSKELNRFEDIKNENKRLSEEVAALSELQNEYKNQIEDLIIERDNINDKLSEFVQKNEKEVKVFDAQTVENERICLEYRKVISKLEEDLGSSVREVEKLKRKNHSLQESLEHVKDTEQQIANRTSEEILKLVQENSDLMEISRKLEQKHNDVTHVECQTVDNASGTDLEEVVTSLKRENSELLTEMNEMNQALKERGETISKFQAHCEEVMKKLQIYETQANRNVDNITQKEEVIKKLEQEIEKLKNQELVVESAVNQDVINKKNVEISDLKNEIESLKERLNVNLDASYAESESMSTSTISRSEEVNRLKDLEGSWEERYGKLRNLAVKLKGKVRDLSGELVKEQNEKNDLQLKVTNNAKIISSLQVQFDQLQDELETKRQENKEYSDKLDAIAGNISIDKQKLAGNDDFIVSLKKEIEELKQEKINTEAWKKQISAKVQAFRKELEANKVLKKEYEAKIAKLTSELDAKQQALKLESDGHQQTRHSLEHSNSERMKNSVLSLEMQDYERSVKELSQKLEKKQEEIGKLKSQLDSQKTTSNAIREQNKLLEEMKEEMKIEVTSCQAEIINYKKQISEIEEVTLQKENKLQDLTQLLEAVRSENEELSTELSKVISEHQKLNGGLRSEKEHLRGQVLGLQQSLREVQDTLKLKEDELRVVQADYDTYKVRAQSVLRQNQSRDVGLEEKISEELSTLQQRSERLSTEVKDCKDTIDSLRKENESLMQQKRDISGKYEDLSSEVEDLKSLYEQLSSKHQQTVMEHAETVRSLKIHAETLAQCYRQQLSEQEVRHNREIIELQSKIEKAPSPTEMQFPPLPSMHREEGEGSESTENVSKNNVHPVPLERLLGTDTDQEVLFIKKQLAEEESKVNHLAALLADTEQDLAKHVQMTKLLKEEIRRQQRSVEREKHAENLEYLKNVVFKFVTLHSGDERTRLVPVLNTILKLSPEETQKLTMVARGDPGIRGWTNYLPSWPSPSKPS